MQIEYDDRFINKFLDIWNFISKDSVNRANQFEEALKNKIFDIPNFPYSYRASIYFENEAIRDLIFKGYTIPFKIDETNNKIVILGIVKYQEKF